MKNKDEKKMQKFLKTKIFGLVLGGVIFLLITFLSLGPFKDLFVQGENSLTTLFHNLRLRQDVNFQIQDNLRVGMRMRKSNPNVHPDLMILGIDNRALSRLGRFPFRRSVYATMFQNFARISNESNRESASFLDVFFIEPGSPAEEDSMLQLSMEENQRVYLETLLMNNPLQDRELHNDFNKSLEAMLDRQGSIQKVFGTWENMTQFFAQETPLLPLAENVGGFGHANYLADFDEIYRRAPLVAKYSKLIEDIPLEELEPDTTPYRDLFQRYTYFDRSGLTVTIRQPIEEENISAIQNTVRNYSLPYVTQNAEGEEVASYRIQKYQEYFIPTITLSLALNYWRVSFEDIEVHLGSHILIPNPKQFNYESGQWVPYRILQRPEKYALNEEGQMVLIEEARYKVIEEVKIPINENGQMLINFAGPRTTESMETYPYRSILGYATSPISADESSWRPTRRLENKILMIGAFSQGIADDEKLTPYGMMYGVEIHTNALNTMLMNNFITELNVLFHVLLFLIAIGISSFLASRMSPLWALFANINALFIWLTISYIGYMEYQTIIPLLPILFGVALVYLVVVGYRVIVEEKEKRSLQNSFGKFVNPVVVEQMLNSPPELGGVDKELTVLFSDIRGFTTLSEGLAPQELVNHLNEYLTAMTDIIMDYQGTLDKYVGDEIMCFWGAPLDQAVHAELAAKCALKQIQRLNELNQAWPEYKKIEIGIGINSGIMTVGNMGSKGRMNYTLMGDNVNLGARLEGINKVYGTHIIISEYTYSLIKEKAIVRELDNIRVKGKNKPVLIYELVDFKDGYDRN